MVSKHLTRFLSVHVTCILPQLWTLSLIFYRWGMAALRSKVSCTVVMPGPRPSRRVWSGDTYFLWLPFAALVEQPIRGIWSGEKGEEGTLKTTRAAGCNDLKCASEDMTNLICSIFIFSFVFFWGEGWGLHEPEWGYASSPCARGLEAVNLSHHFQRGNGGIHCGIQVMGSQEEVGKLETSHGKKPGTQYIGGWYIHSYIDSEISWRIILTSWKSLVSKGYSDMMKLKQMFYSALYLLIPVKQKAAGPARAWAQGVCLENPNSQYTSCITKCLTTKENKGKWTRCSRHKWITQITEHPL